VATELAELAPKQQFTHRVSLKRRMTRHRLLNGCGLDTSGMVQIVEARRRICNE
jgi:hypothetical protein